jgi:mRNA interferase MazF
MRPIHLAMLDKTRPALVLTRVQVRHSRRWVTVAPITSTARGLTTEVAVGLSNGLDHDSVVGLDNITTIPVADLGREIGWLLPEQELALTEAIHAAFDLD